MTYSCSHIYIYIHTHSQYLIYIYIYVCMYRGSPALLGVCVYVCVS